MSDLTQMQRNYIWLMGSYPTYQMFQGQGKRSDRLLYALKHEEQELYIFGYSNPPYFLLNRGLISKGQAPHSYNLTAEGSEVFDRLLGAGGVYSTNFREARFKD